MHEFGSIICLLLSHVMCAHHLGTLYYFKRQTFFNMSKVLHIMPNLPGISEFFFLLCYDIYIELGFQHLGASVCYITSLAATDVKSIYKTVIFFPPSFLLPLHPSSSSSPPPPPIPHSFSPPLIDTLCEAFQ